MIVFYELRGRDYEEIGRVADGEIISGRDQLDNIVYAPNLNDEDELLDVHNGPHVLSQKVEGTEKWLPHEDEDGKRGWIKSDASEVRYDDEPPGAIVKGFESQADGWTDEDSDTIDKRWIPYEGPEGGEGWQNIESGEVRYTEEPPGPVETQGDDEPNQSPQRWGSWDGEDEDEVPGMPDNEPDTPTERDEITWENVQEGDEVVYHDKYGEIQEGEVTAVEQDGFGVVWVEGDDGIKYSVEEDDFRGGIGETLGETVEPPEEGATTEWMDENLFFGQTVKLFNSKTDSVVYADVKDIMVAGGEVNAVDFEIEQSNGFTTNITLTSEDIDWGSEDSNDVFEIRATEKWDSLSKEERNKALEQSFDSNTRLTNMSADTRRNVTSQVKDEIIPSLADSTVARQTMKNLFKMENSVSRASCAGVGGYTIKVSERSPLDTLHHEFGHGVVSAYGYHYQRVRDKDDFTEEKWRRRPTNLSHDFHDLSSRDGIVDFDFSEDSSFFEAEAYMLRPDEAVLFEDFDVSETESGDVISIELYDDTNFDSEDYEIESVVGPDSAPDNRWMLEVSERGREFGAPSRLYIGPDGTATVYRSTDQGGKFKPVGEFAGKYGRESPPGYDEWAEEVEREVGVVAHPDLQDRDYQDPDRSPKEIFADLSPGDAVKLNVPTREPNTQYLSFNGVNEAFSDEESIAYTFEEANGNEWTWPVMRESGELQSEHGSTLEGYDPTRSAEGDDENPTVDHPLGHWDGFNPNPENAEDKMDNLVSAVNRAWYKQAKQFESSSDLFENMRQYIGSGYSATNAHETMAQTHQVIQDGDTYALSNLMDAHPSLVAAYADVFRIPEDSASFLRDNEEAQKYGIEP